MGAAEGGDRAIGERVMRRQRRRAGSSPLTSAPVGEGYYGPSISRRHGSSSRCRPGGGAAIDRWSSVPHRERAVGTRHVGLPEIRGTASRRAAASRAAPLDVPTPRSRGRVRMLPSAAASVAGTTEEEFLARRGQRQSNVRRTAPRQRAPATSTTRASSRCSPAPCARSRPPSSAARDVLGAHEVPGRRPAGARRARPGEGGRGQHRGAPRRAG